MAVVNRKSIVWNGGAITERMRAAQIRGINATMGACVVEAKGNHPWQNQTSVLEGSIDIVTYAAPKDGGVEGVWGSRDVNYALIHELGGVITAKNGHFLTIPVTEEARKSLGARTMNLSYGKTAKGQPVLLDPATGIVHWLLKKSVKIPARPYLRPAGDKHYPSLPDRIRAAYQESARG